MHRVVMASLLVAASFGISRAEEIPLSGESHVVLFDREAGAKFLREPDAFTSTTGELERRMRLKSAEPVSEAELLQHSSEQTVDWTDSERDRIRQTITACRERLERWKLPLPKTIPIIKTNGRDEGGAAYTRREAIILPQSMLAGGGASLEPL